MLVCSANVGAHEASIREKPYAQILRGFCDTYLPECIELRRKNERNPVFKRNRCHRNLCCHLARFKRLDEWQRNGVLSLNHDFLWNFSPLHLSAFGECPLSESIAIISTEEKSLSQLSAVFTHRFPNHIHEIYLTFPIHERGQLFQI